MKISKESLVDLKAGASRGGAAAKGDRKRRNMQGVKPGKGSAGRVNAGAKKARTDAAASMPVTYFSDVKQACTVWLLKRGLRVGGFRDLMLKEIHEAKLEK